MRQASSTPSARTTRPVRERASSPSLGGTREGRRSCPRAPVFSLPLATIRIVPSGHRLRSPTFDAPLTHPVALCRDPVSDKNEFLPPNDLEDLDTVSFAVATIDFLLDFLVGH